MTGTPYENWDKPHIPTGATIDFCVGFVQYFSSDAFPPGMTAGHSPSRMEPVLEWPGVHPFDFFLWEGFPFAGKDFPLVSTKGQWIPVVQPVSLQNQPTKQVHNSFLFSMLRKLSSTRLA